MRFSVIAMALWLLLKSLCLAQGIPPTKAGLNAAQTSIPADAANPQTPPRRTIRIQRVMAPEKEADIRKLLDMVGTRSLMVNMMGEMEKNIRPLLTNAIPAGVDRDRLIQLFLDRFHAKADPEQLVDLVVPIYDKYFSDEDVKGLIAFYSTPLGKKAISNLPKVSSESYEAGRNWGERVGRESMTEVLAEHPELSKSLTEQPATGP